MNLLKIMKKPLLSTDIHLGEMDFPCLKRGHSLTNHLSYWKSKYDEVSNNESSSYLSIQIRNTDRYCDYKSLYEEYEEQIQKYDAVYVATDDREALEFMQSKISKVFNFTDFPQNVKNRKRGLHYPNDVNTEIKVRDLLCDLYLMAMSDKIITKSLGGYCKLAKSLNADKKRVREQLLSS